MTDEPPAPGDAARTHRDADAAAAPHRLKNDRPANGPTDIRPADEKTRRTGWPLIVDIGIIISMVLGIIVSATLALLFLL